MIKFAKDNNSKNLITFFLILLNLVYGSILGWRSVSYHFRDTVTLALTSDLFSIIIVLGATVKFLIKLDFFHLL